MSDSVGKEHHQLDNFTNDSAMMIAWERALETKREDALFTDPFAETLAGSKGQTLSDQFGNMCKMFEFEDWSEFHKSWVAVRTRFIDDCISRHAATSAFAQLVNLGAGMDTRAYRMKCYRSLANGSFEVDMSVINEGRTKIVAEFLGAPSPHCAVSSIDLDFLDEERTLATELGKAESRFEAQMPTVFVSEGLIMYLGAKGKLKLIADVSAVAAPGSVFILQFMDASESESAKTQPGSLENALSVEEATGALTEHGWDNLEFAKYGDEQLNFGRFPADRFKPSAAFSFCVCTKKAVA